jgi:hypothetical protein
VCLWPLGPKKYSKKSSLNPKGELKPCVVFSWIIVSTLTETTAGIALEATVVKALLVFL